MRRALLVGLLLLGALHPVAQADAGRFTGATFKTSKGSLFYKTYTPGVPARNLVVVLHGAGEDADTTALHSQWNAVAQRFRFVVVYPQQNLDYDSGLKWDWPGASKDGRADREASLIAGITKLVTARNHLDPHRVFVTGISAGAGMATAMAVAFPDLYSGLGIEAGCPFDNVGCAGGSITAEQSAAAVLKGMGRFRRPLPVFNEYGSADPIAIGVSSNRVIASWLAVDDTLDDGRDNRSVSRDASSVRTMTPAAPMKPYTVSQYRDRRGCRLGEDWYVYGESHAWAGGKTRDAQDTGSDPLAPDVTTAMYRFFTAPDTLRGSRGCRS